MLSGRLSKNRHDWHRARFNLFWHGIYIEFLRPIGMMEEIKTENGSIVSYNIELKLSNKTTVVVNDMQDLGCPFTLLTLIGRTDLSKRATMISAIMEKNKSLERTLNAMQLSIEHYSGSFFDVERAMFMNVGFVKHQLGGIMVNMKRGQQPATPGGGEGISFDLGQPEF